MKFKKLQNSDILKTTIKESNNLKLFNSSVSETGFDP